jgi:hypothetical protein
MDSGLPAKEKGSFLEDTVGEIFSNWGFDVQKRVKLKDKFEIEHEIDVLARKKEVFGIVQIAVECKYLTTPTGIKEIRNFRDKLSSLGITKGIIVSTGGFTSDAEAHAKSSDIETWDLATLQEKIGQTVSRKGVISEALPVAQNITDHFLPSYIANNDAFLLLGKAHVQYHPYFYVGYHCFSQDRAGGELVVLESRGMVALDGVQGWIYDSDVRSGIQPNIPSTKTIIGLASVRPTGLTTGNVIANEKLIEPEPEVVQPKIGETEAKSTVQRELTKNLATGHRYFVGSSQRWKVIRPHKKDVEITSCDLVNVPLLDFKLVSGNKTYARLIEGVKGAVLRDEMSHCLFCKKNAAEVVCEACGSVACKDHSKRCESCGKPICVSCIVSKGIVFKKHYCPEHGSMTT